MKIIKSKKLSAFPNLIQASSTKNLSEELFLQKLDLKSEDIITCETVHSNKIKIVNKNQKGKMIPKTDGLITKDINVFLALYTADCIPLFLYDPKEIIIGLFHAGWKGSLNNISTKAVKLMEKKFKSEPKDIIAYLGPGISVCCYDNMKHPERIKLFHKEFNAGVVRGTYIDLKLTNLIALQKAGLKEDNIEISPYCTGHSNLFPSHHFEREKRKESIINVMGIK